MEKRVSRGLAVGDLFNDGNMDVVIEDLDGSPMILQNHRIEGRHWVSFELAGTKSNRLAIGARLTTSVVEIGKDHAETIIAARVLCSRRFRHVRKGAVTVVVE
jgi:hypothetical protein